MLKYIIIYLSAMSLLTFILFGADKHKARAHNGYRKSFYDWCLDNNKGDRRMKAGKESSLKAFNQGQSFGVAATGWLVWGLALYWLFGEKLAVGACAIIGAIVSLALFKLSRQGSTFTCIILPIIIAVICATR